MTKDVKDVFIKMLKIAICDNEKNELQNLLDLVDQYLNSHPENQGRVCSFCDSKKIAECIRAGMVFDIYLLDILMPDVNGIEIGRMIQGRNADKPIIYTTSSVEFALLAFENHAIRYLVKPIEKSELYSALDLAFSLNKCEKPTLYTVKTAEGVITVPADEILYIENRARTAIYRLDSGASIESLKIRSTFEQTVAPIGDDPNFLHPHKSFFINMGHIQVMEQNTITMDNGQSLPVSRKCRHRVTQKYLGFVSNSKGAQK